MSFFIFTLFYLACKNKLEVILARLCREYINFFYTKFFSYKEQKKKINVNKNKNDKKNVNKLKNLPAHARFFSII